MNKTGTIWSRLKLRIGTCWRTQHSYRYDGDSLIGDWIRCRRCHHLEEYVPGLHEPKGYVNK